MLKSYLVVACTAFMVGFMGYWMLGQAVSVDASPPASAYQAPASADLPAMDFNRGKRI